MSYINTIRTFIRVYELGSMSAAARDQRVSAAVASARIAQLEEQLQARLFTRTTRSLHPTEQGKIFYDGARRILEAIEIAEAEVSEATQNPRGTLHISAPLGIGRRFLAPQIPGFKAQFPMVDLRMRMSDRSVDLTAEGLDIALHYGRPENSDLKMRQIANCPRLLCAAPDYIKEHGMPETGQDLIGQKHACLVLRFPGVPEFRWPLQTPEGVQNFAITGPFDSDDGQVLLDWALMGHGIILKPRFEVAAHLDAGALVEVCPKMPPIPSQLCFLYPPRTYEDPKLRHFIDYMTPRLARAIAL